MGAMTGPDGAARTMDSTIWNGDGDGGEKFKGKESWYICHTSQPGHWGETKYGPIDKTSDS